MDNLPPEATGGAWAGLLVLGYALIRKFGLYMSRDVTTFKEDKVERSSIDMLQDRVQALDARVNELEQMRYRLFAFSARSMAYITQCQCEGIDPPTREELQRDYADLIESLSPERPEST